MRKGRADSIGEARTSYGGDKQAPGEFKRAAATPGEAFLLLIEHGFRG